MLDVTDTKTYAITFGWLHFLFSSRLVVTNMKIQSLNLVYYILIRVFGSVSE